MFAMRPTKALSLLFVLTCIAPSKAREWTDTSRNESIEADFVECRVILRLPSGRRKLVDLSSLSEADRNFVLDEVRKRAGDTAQDRNRRQRPELEDQVGAGARQPNANADNANRARNAAAQKHAEFGSVKLTAEEIQLEEQRGQNELLNRSDPFVPPSAHNPFVIGHSKFVISTRTIFSVTLECHWLCQCVCRRQNSAGRALGEHCDKHCPPIADSPRRAPVSAVAFTGVTTRAANDS